MARRRYNLPHNRYNRRTWTDIGHFLMKTAADMIGLAGLFIAVIFAYGWFNG